MQYFGKQIMGGNNTYDKQNAFPKIRIHNAANKRVHVNHEPHYFKYTEVYGETEGPHVQSPVLQARSHSKCNAYSGGQQEWRLLWWQGQKFCSAPEGGRLYSCGGVVYPEDGLNVHPADAGSFGESEHNPRLIPLPISRKNKQLGEQIADAYY